MDKKFIQEMQTKITLELKNKEKEVLSYWKDELKKLLGQKHQDLASQTNAINNLIKKMETRLTKV